MATRGRKPRSGLTPRNIVMPAAALVMAGILYTYSVTSIRAAKRNAQLHREADGGQLDMRKESLRRHGALEAVEGTKGLELFRKAGVTDTQSEDKLLTEKQARDLGDAMRPGEAEAAPRTNVEGVLQEFKGTNTGAAMKRFRESVKDS